MEVIQKIQEDNSVKPITEDSQVIIKGGRNRLTYSSKIDTSQSSPPRWKDE